MMMSLTTNDTSHGTANNSPYLDKSQCRTCLAAMDQNQHYLFEQVSIGDEMVQTASIVMACASVQILLNDFYPQYICRKCLNEAINSYAFRSKCELSQQRLLEASHVGTLKVETTTHLPTLTNQQQQFKVETVDAYEVDVNTTARRAEINDGAGRGKEGDSDDDDYMPGDAFGGDISSDDEVLANMVSKKETRSSARIKTTTSRAASNRKRKSATPPRPIQSTPSAQYMCRQCDAIFSTRIAFIKHRDTHASFICRWCAGSKVAFATYETLLSHMRKKHKDEYQKQGDSFGTKEEKEEDVDEEEVVGKKRKLTHKVKKVAKKAGKKRVVNEDRDDIKVESADLDEDDDDNENSAPSIASDPNDPNCSSTSTPHQCHFCYKYYISESSLTTHITFCPSKSSANSVPPTVDIAKISGVFTCNICSRHFRTFRARSDHQRTHKGGVFCPYCGLHMPYRSMVNHRKREHGLDKDMVCDLCSGVYRGVDNLESHMTTHKSFTCSECNFTTKYIDEFRSHMFSYELKKIADSENGTCRECGEQQKDTKALIEHYDTYTMVTCQECEANYDNMVHLVQHTSKAHSDIDMTVPEGDRKCTVCAKQFLSVEGMWQHRAKHNVETGPDGESCGELFCAYCNFRPKNNVSLGRHMQEEHHSQKTETCTVCDKSFFSAGKLKVHMLTHNADKQHVCEVCGAGFALKGNLNVHMRVHTGEKPYKCEICGHSTRYLRHFKSHMDRHEQPAACYHCLICGKTVKSKESLRRHLNTLHDNILQSPTNSHCPICGKIFKNQLALQIHEEKSHVCHICKKCFQHEYILQRHYIREHRERPKKREFFINNYRVLDCKVSNGTEVYICESCEFIGCSMNDINEHMRSDAHLQGPSMFHCLQCKKTFASRNLLCVHISNIHDIVRKNKRMQTCNVCGKQLCNPTNLKLHMRTHTGEKPYKCNICDHRFTQTGSLRLHMRTHELSQVTAAICPTCGKSFRHKPSYYAHVKTAHSNVRPFACTQCDKKFFKNDTLQRHIETHANIRTNVCPYCGKEFLRRSSLTVHVKIHTGERPHQCRICGRGFLQKHVRESHMKTHETT